MKRDKQQKTQGSDFERASRKLEKVVEVIGEKAEASGMSQDFFDELFADPRSEVVLSEMARRARAEYEAGETTSMEDFLKG